VADNSVLQQETGIYSRPVFNWDSATAFIWSYTVGWLVSGQSQQFPYFFIIVTFQSERPQSSREYIYGNLKYSVCVRDKTTTNNFKFLINEKVGKISPSDATNCYAQKEQPQL